MRGLLLLTLWLAPTLAWGQALICIDPGHGGNDPGAVGCGQQEKVIVLDTSQKLRTKLLAAGFQVVMTRSNDSAVSLIGRSNYANSQGADRFVSIHANSAAQVATGIETFCHTSGGTSLDMRDKIQEEMIATWPLRNRGGKTANFSVLRETSMPASLTELGFVNNCSVDVPYLSDPVERDRAAEAHLRALQRHLGMQVPPTTGRLVGVAFEDTGAGLGDTSIRLPSAVATVVETSDTDSTDAMGIWEFNLPPGNYTVRLEIAGYVAGSNTCAVVAGMDNWCSFGLFKDGVPDAGTLDLGDMGPKLDAGDFGTATDSGAPADTGAPADIQSMDMMQNPETGGGPDVMLPPLGDAGRADFGTDGGAPGGNGIAGNSGCSCSAQETRGSSPWWLAALLLGLLGARRRRAWPLAVLLMLPLSAQAAPEVGTAVKVAKGSAPVIAPDGQHIAVSRARLDILEVLSLDGQRSTVREGRGAGLRPLWTAKGSLLIRPARQPFAAVTLSEVSSEGRLLGPAPQKIAQRDDAIWWSDAQISPKEGRFFAPIVSPDQRFVVYESMEQGLFLYDRQERQNTPLGRGSNANFSGDSALLVFERPQDDGHRVTASGLFFVDLGDSALRAQLLLDGAEIERHGSLSRPDAQGDRKLAFEVDGFIFVAPVRLSSSP